MFLFFINLNFSAGAAVDSKFNQGLDATGQSANYPVAAASNPGNFLAKMFGTVMSPMLFGVTAMLILIYGGWTLMMARGDEQQVEKAKAVITNTIFAMIVMFSAYAILKLIIPLWQFVVSI